jgi:hypothetical protein
MDILQTGADFPRIDEQGKIVRRIKSMSPTYVNVERALLDKALQMFRGRIAIQWDALSQLSLAHYASDVIAAGKQGAVIGWQMNAGGGMHIGSLCGATLPGVPCDNAGYQLMLDNGIDNGAQYIEVLPVNVLRFRNALLEAQSRLQKRH